MKKHLFFAFSLLVLIFSGCEKNESDGSFSINGTTVSKGASVGFAFSYAAQDTTLTLNATSSWTAYLVDGAEAWLSITPLSGVSGEHQIAIEILENSAEEQRTGKILMESGGFSFYFVVTQAKHGEEAPSDDPSDAFEYTDERAFRLNMTAEKVRSRSPRRWIRGRRRFRKTLLNG